MTPVFWLVLWLVLWAACSPGPPKGASAETVGFEAGPEASVPRASSAPNDDRTPSLQARLWELVAEDRRGRGLTALERAGALDALATAHSAAMLAAGTLSHDGSSERFSRLRQDFGVVAAAENVGMACGHGERTAQVLLSGWLQSEGHRKNLHGDFDLSGLGVASDGDCAYATQLFGKAP